MGLQDIIQQRFHTSDVYVKTNNFVPLGVKQNCKENSKSFWATIMTHFLKLRKHSFCIKEFIRNQIKATNQYWIITYKCYECYLPPFTWAMFNRIQSFWNKQRISWLEGDAIGCWVYPNLYLLVEKYSLSWYIKQNNLLRCILWKKTMGTMAKMDAKRPLRSIDQCTTPNSKYIGGEWLPPSSMYVGAFQPH